MEGHTEERTEGYLRGLAEAYTRDIMRKNGGIYGGIYNIQ